MFASVGISISPTKCLTSSVSMFILSAEQIIPPWLCWKVLLLLETLHHHLLPHFSVILDTCTEKMKWRKYQNFTFVESWHNSHPCSASRGRGLRAAPEPRPWSAVSPPPSSRPRQQQNRLLGRSLSPSAHEDWPKVCGLAARPTNIVKAQRFLYALIVTWW